MKHSILLISIVVFIIIPDISFSNNENHTINHQISNMTDYKMVVLSGTESSFDVSNQIIVPYSPRIEKLIQKGLQKRSDYFVSLYNKEGSVIYKYGVGNPFLIYLQHHGYEDEFSVIKKDKAEIQIYFPAELNPVKISLHKYGEIFPSKSQLLGTGIVSISK